MPLASGVTTSRAALNAPLMPDGGIINEGIPSCVVGEIEGVVGAVVVDVVGLRYYQSRPPVTPAGSGVMPDRVAVIREPQNTYDPNALKIVNISKGNEQLGHLPRAVSALLSPLLDLGLARVAACIARYTPPTPPATSPPQHLSLFLTVFSAVRHIGTCTLAPVASCPNFVAASPFRTGC